MTARRRIVESVGPDAIHLCLTVGARPHLFGCAWASYGEARLPGPSTAARREPRGRLPRTRRLPPPEQARGPLGGGPPCTGG